MSEEFDFGIELTRQFFESAVSGRTTAYRMVVQVSNTYNVDPNVFLKERVQPAMGTDAPIDEFRAVCTPVDLEEYGIGEPLDGDTFFRVSSIDLLSRDIASLEDAWTCILADRDELIRTLQAISVATGTQVSAYGYMGPESSSSDGGSSDG